MAPTVAHPGNEWRLIKMPRSYRRIDSFCELLESVAAKGPSGLKMIIY